MYSTYRIILQHIILHNSFAPMDFMSNKSEYFYDAQRASRNTGTETGYKSAMFIPRPAECAKSVSNTFIG